MTGSFKQSLKFLQIQVIDSIDLPNSNCIAHKVQNQNC